MSRLYAVLLFCVSRQGLKSRCCCKIDLMCLHWRVSAFSLHSSEMDSLVISDQGLNQYAAKAFRENYNCKQKEIKKIAKYFYVWEIFLAHRFILISVSTEWIIKMHGDLAIRNLFSWCPLSEWFTIVELISSGGSGLSGEKNRNRRIPQWIICLATVRNLHKIHSQGMPF